MGGDMGSCGLKRVYSRQKRLSGHWHFLIAVMVVQFAYQTARESPLPSWVKPTWAVLMLVSFSWLALYPRRARTVVGVDGITVRWIIRERRRAWRDIYDIRVEANAYAGRHQPSAFACLYDTDGRRLRLPFLDEMNVEALRTEVADVRAAAARHRGTAWERRPEVEERIRRRAAHRQAWGSAALCAVVVLVGMVVVMAVLFFTADDLPSPLLMFLWIPLASFVLLAALFNWRVQALSA
ncbi:hypothetical protein [Streptomyces dysideae]|uniref:PH domain-containing protein n=1 Tax=Streptomyces dysideae TaxID=909626 RepID=A0A101V130_9ACTN|nr:hypothetical protein [Streptomyces dysideae]KUO20576.1 hypothetical protein AQJ91_13510 [Streptomyces dysideae]